MKPDILSASKHLQLNDALLTQIESKLDVLLDRQEVKVSNAAGSSKETNVCYFRREQGDLANKCKEWVNCQGYGGNMHLYDRC